MRRGSVFHSSLNRARLYAGIPLNAFLLIILGGAFCFIARAYWVMPSAIVLWAVARWATVKDSSWMVVLEQYLREDHVYDSLPRPKDFSKRPLGWGRDLPW